MDVQIITIGDEILIGQIIDTNSAWIGEQLNLYGFHVQKVVSVSDQKEAIIHNLEGAWAESDVVLLTGGLGPTKDDITKKALAEFFKVPFIFHQETYDRIIRIFKRFGRSTTDAHREQCFMPENATLLRNKMGTAPGMWFEKQGKIIVSMPGVPYEMKYLMEFEVLPRLRNKFAGTPIAHRTILTVGEGESRIAARIEKFEQNLPSNIKLAYLPNLGKVRLRLSGTGKSEKILNAQLDDLVGKLKPLIGDLIYGVEKEKLAEVVGRELKNQGKTISTAESCTGGYLAHQITSVPGSSAYFQGSIIAYSNEVKERLLGVDAETLSEHGAVSEETVVQMAKGVLKSLNTDLGIAVSGIAGPGGGTPAKPVGTIWMAITDGERVETKKLQLGKDRLRNIHYTGTQALNLIRVFLLQKPIKELIN